MVFLWFPLGFPTWGTAPENLGHRTTLDTVPEAMAAAGVTSSVVEPTWRLGGRGKVTTSWSMVDVAMKIIIIVHWLNSDYLKVL